MDELSAAIFADLLKDRPGWTGNFTTQQAGGAIPNGTRIRKITTEHKDAHPVGSIGTVLGSLEAQEGKLLYFIEWDARPRWAVAVADFKIGEA